MVGAPYLNLEMTLLLLLTVPTFCPGLERQGIIGQAKDEVPVFARAKAHGKAMGDRQCATAALAIACGGITGLAFFSERSHR